MALPDVPDAVAAPNNTTVCPHVGALHLPANNGELPAFHIPRATPNYAPDG